MTNNLLYQPPQGDYQDCLPILVVGLPGVPGFNAFYHFRTLFGPKVAGIGPPNAPLLTTPGSPFCPMDGTSGIIPADPENPKEIEKLFATCKFLSVIDASGWCALKSAEMDPALARRMNVNIGVNVMAEAKRHGARLIRLSTDLVFDGMPYLRDGKLIEGDYLEDWPVSPVTVYGKMMAESERLILEGHPDAAILRIALPMGPSLNGHAGAIDWIESRFKKGRPATLYYDEVRSSLYVQDLNQVLLHFLRNGARGIFHVGGPRALSLHQIAQVVNKVGDYDPDLLMGCLRAAAGPMPPRAGNVEMNTEKVRALLPENTLKPWPLLTEHVPDGPDWHRRRERRFAPGSILKELYGRNPDDAWDHPTKILPAELFQSVSCRAAVAR